MTLPLTYLPPFQQQPVETFLTVEQVAWLVVGLYFATAIVFGIVIYRSRR